MTLLPHSRHALDDERDRLMALARALEALAPPFAAELSQVTARFQQRAGAASSLPALERLLERHARELRGRWLQFSARGPSFVYRSPTEAQQAELDDDPLLESFGYERDLQPSSLEARCHRFFAAPPHGWGDEHLLFSSGQAAMNVCLTALRQAVRDRPLRVAHLGGYFETTSLLTEQPASFTVVDGADIASADCIVAEPISCTGRFAAIGVEDVLAALASASSCRALVLDTTLVGRGDYIDSLLCRLPKASTLSVFRVCSALKLFQQGLELANTGMLSCYGRASTDGEASVAIELIRKLRTLTGSGLRLTDALALEAPFVFEPDLTDQYEQAVFRHNARLVRAVHADNRLFEALSHPALDDGQAPYCTFRLHGADESAYQQLESLITREVGRRELVVDRGGSFGFRGHRYEVVWPDTGESPFLRVAMGCREGWSCDGMIELMVELARRETLQA